MAPIDVVQAQSEQATRRQALVTAQSTQAHHRARAEAPHRRRHAGSELECADRPDRPARLPRRSRSTSRRPCAARSASAPTSRSRRRTSQSNDVTLKYLRDQMLPQADLSATLRVCRASAARINVRDTGHRRRPSNHERIPGGIADALQHAVQQRLPALDRRDERLLSARRRARRRRRSRARACS